MSYLNGQRHQPGRAASLASLPERYLSAATAFCAASSRSSAEVMARPEFLMISYGVRPYLSAGVGVRLCVVEPL